MSSRPKYCYPVTITESSRFRPDPDDQDTFLPLYKNKHIEELVFSRDLANALAKEYFIRQHGESDWDSNENHFGQPTARARKWGIWVPSDTTKCTISEVERCCRIEVILGSGTDRTEFLVEVLRKEISDANGPLARHHAVGRIGLIDHTIITELTYSV